MLIFAPLGWSLLEAILKSKDRAHHGNWWRTDPHATTEDLQPTKHSSKCTFTPCGGHSTSCKTNYLSGNFSLGGTMSTGMTVSDNKNCLLEDLGNSFWKSPNVPHCMTLESKRKGGGFVSFDRPWIWGELLSHTCRKSSKHSWIPEIDIWCS